MANAFWKRMGVPCVIPPYATAIWASISSGTMFWWRSYTERTSKNKISHANVPALQTRNTKDFFYQWHEPNSRTEYNHYVHLYVSTDEKFCGLFIPKYRLSDSHSIPSMLYVQYVTSNGNFPSPCPEFRVKILVRYSINRMMIIVLERGYLQWRFEEFCGWVPNTTY